MFRVLNLVALAGLALALAGGCPLTGSLSNLLGPPSNTTADPNEVATVKPPLDSDNDGTPDAVDGCPNDPHKTAPGQCGCGAPDADSDGDGAVDCVDGCPNDPSKTEPGECGCGTPETEGCGWVDPNPPVQKSVTIWEPGGSGSNPSYPDASTLHIAWTSIGSISNVRIELLYDPAALGDPDLAQNVDTVIATSTENDGSYDWTVPAGQHPNSDYFVRVSDLADASVNDVSREIGVGGQQPSPDDQLFFDDFEGGLGKWVGANGGAHHGQIVVDTAGTGNHALTFTGVASGGDLFSTAIAVSPGTTIELSFDYRSQGGHGYIGYSSDTVPGAGVKWVGGDETSGTPPWVSLNRDGAWHSYSVQLAPASATLRIVIEDHGTTPGPVFFDNIKVSGSGGSGGSYEWFEWRVADGGNGHKYAVIEQLMTFDGAEGAAVAAGGHLATINNAAENEWIYNTFHNAYDYNYLMIGFTDRTQDGHWAWVSGEGGWWELGNPDSTSYVAWHPAEPNGGTAENYAALYTEGPRIRTWVDVADRGDSYPNGAQYALIEVP